MKLLGKYKNGNYTVTLFSDGTKIRENDLDHFRADFPESMDLKITNKCDMGCIFCFPPNAKLIKGDSKSKAIRGIQPGLELLSYNEEKADLEIKEVVKTYKRKYSGKLIKITLADNRTIECTPNHKIFTQNRGYVEAAKLTLDDDLLTI
ncbi:MAG: polymorphic toxin-type HINT domain-containing protein [Bacilli bacterium]|nr:polymorphic toxin-type HINT domain-containing protein [Bacilli bacterium]